MELANRSSLVSVLTNSSLRHRSVLAALSIFLIAVFIISLGIGQVQIPPGAVVAILLNKLGVGYSVVDEVQSTIILTIRLPRLILTLLVGSGLAVAGASLQGLFRNSLVEPGLIGVSGGAALFVVTLVVFGGGLIGDSVPLPLTTSIAAFGGGLVTTWLVSLIGTASRQRSISSMVLAGVAVNALAGALMGLIIFYADENQLRTFTFWTLGDLSGAQWDQLLIAGPILLIAITGLLTFGRSLNALAIGGREAFHMGVDVSNVRKYVIALAALAVGVSVSLAGIIGFIGLVVPHLVRIALDADNRLVLPASAIAGAALLIVADMIARTIVAPAELPIGVVTALFGAPFFIFLLIRTGQKLETIE